jgi:hypothetical protein
MAPALIPCDERHDHSTVGGIVVPLGGQHRVATESVHEQGHQRPPAPLLNRCMPPGRSPTSKSTTTKTLNTRAIQAMR